MVLKGDGQRSCAGCGSGHGPWLQEWEAREMEGASINQSINPCSVCVCNGVDETWAGGTRLRNVHSES